MKHLACFFIRLYRKLISPIKPPCCRFTPSCSRYALEAFTHRGFLIGAFLSLRRILRCNPFGGYGYDPVPRHVAWKKLDLLRKKMGERPNVGQGASSDIVMLEKKHKRKVATLLPYEKERETKK